MKIKLLIASLLLSAFSYQNALATEQNTMMQSSSPSAQQGQMDNDASMLGWLVVLNKNEISISKTVLERQKLDPMVKDYARYLLNQHTNLLQETMTLSKKIKVKPVESQDATKLKEDGEKGMKDLQPLTGMDFQKSFIDAMVTGHAQALDALNKDIQNEHDPKLKSLLETTAKHVAMHLEKAKQIQAKLNS